jgi:sugar O-acyltransferase (sialic acid O-acetyltransferase NeuD family)
MKNIVIYGAGGFGRETSLLLHQINLQSHEWNVIGYCDDGKHAGEKVEHLPVLGGMDYLNAFDEELNVVIAIADPITRENIQRKLHNNNLKFPKLTHPSVFISENCSTGEGSVICSGVIMTVDVHIKSFSIVNLKCTLGHDSVINDFAALMPAVNISGNVSIGRGVYVGAGAVLLQGISVGDYSVVGAGAVVNKSFESNKRIMGVPARAI